MKVILHYWHNTSISEVQVEHGEDCDGTEVGQDRTYYEGDGTDDEDDETDDEDDEQYNKWVAAMLSLLFVIRDEKKPGKP